MVLGVLMKQVKLMVGVLIVFEEEVVVVVEVYSSVPVGGQA